MSNLSRRLKKLELVIVDQSGFPPHSSRWLAYWFNWFDQLVNGEKPPGIAPFEAALAYMRQERPTGHRSHMSNLSRRLKKLELVIVDQSGFPPHSSRWLAYWFNWFDQLVNGEKPPGIAPFEAALAYMRQERPR